MVGAILSRPEYMGHTVNFRSHKESYKDKHGVPNPKEEWLVFENTHEAIIDKETWELAQKLRKTPRRIDTIGEANPFTGLLFCAECGAKMNNHRSRGSGATPYPFDYFDCSSYTHGHQKHLHVCSSHYIRTKALRTLVLDTIRTVSTYAIENQEEFLDKVRSASRMRQAAAAKEAKRKLNKERKRVEELENVIQKLYESYAVGRVSEERFDSLLTRYEEEQKALRESVADAEQQLAVFAEDTARADQFLSLAKKYTDFSELTTPMLNEFVDKIIVHAPEKVDGDRVQEIEIYLKFIGRFDLPAPNPTPEEIEREAFLRKERIRSRKRYQEIKQGTRVRNQPVDLVCKSCGKVFQSKRSDTLFCCVNCRAKYYRQEAAEQRKQDHTCANCGNSFVSQKKNVKYCCTECRDEKLALMRQERNKARNEKKAAVIPESEIE